MKGTAVSLQLEMTVDTPKGYHLTREFMDSVVREWADDGRSPEGINIRIIDWQHPGKPATRAKDQEEARSRFRGLLRSGRFTISLRGN